MSFPITCTACTKTFTISDEIYEKKVAGRVVTIKCKSCSQGIRVDGTKGPGAGKAASEPAPAPAPAVAEAPAAVPAAPVAPSEPLWAVDYPDGQDREFTSSEVITELTRGSINGATLVWRDGMAEWLEAAQVAEFAGEVAKLEAQKKAEAEKLEAQKKAEAEAKKKATAAVAVKQSATATPLHTPRPPMPTETGLAGLPGAEKQKPGPNKSLSTTEPAVPRAKMPSASDGARATQLSGSDLAKPRAKLPSASELGSARAKQPSGLDLGAPRAKQPSGLDLGAPPPPPRAKQPSVPLIKPQMAPTATPLPFSPAPAPVAPPQMLDTPIAARAGATPLPLNSAVSTPPPFVARPPLLTPPLPFDVTPPLPASVAKAVSGPPQTNRPSFP
ncbi:MAG TPA: GYF domain-containing protein, partial [Polyangiaceae bacterium]|nr:GYF domain-containing protein [Polyangiaceae bacterium]